MRLVFTPNGWADYTHWLAADRQNLKRINASSTTRCAIPRRALGSLSPCATCCPERGHAGSPKSIDWCTWWMARTSSSCRLASTMTNAFSCRVHAQVSSGGAAHG